MENKKNSNKFSLISHFLILIFLISICIWDRITNVPKFPYNFIYLTQIDLYINIIYYTLILIQDFKQKNTKKILNKFFNFCFSFSFNAFVMFWLIYLTNSKNLYKKKYKLNFILVFFLHGGVFIINFLEATIINKRKKTQTISLFYYFFLAVIYPFFLRFIYFNYGIKSYPFITKNFYYVFLIVFFSFLVCVFGHFFYVFISNFNVENEEKENELKFIENNEN